MTVTGKRARIYLAGPDVFLPNAKEIGAAKAAICCEAGLVGVFPLDGPPVPQGLDKATQARRIFEVCEGLMRDCDATIANMTPFRGVSIDSGTAYEVGFMRALGRPVFAYTNVVADLADRARWFRQAAPGLSDFDARDVEIEDFGLAENLMLEIAVVDSGGTVVRADVEDRARNTDLAGFRECVAQAAAHFASSAESDA